MGAFPGNSHRQQEVNDKKVSNAFLKNIAKLRKQSADDFATAQSILNDESLKEPRGKTKVKSKAKSKAPK